MKKKRLVVALSVSAMLIAATVGTTLAYFTDKDTRSNVITMGKVDGTLTETDETTHDGGVGQVFDNIKPGQTVNKDPKVTLDADSEDAYVRVSVDYTGLNETQQADLDAAIKTALNKGWVVGEDGYYYYNTIMKAKDSSVVFDKFVIPATWGNEVAELKFNVNVTAEFIQADNFTPTVVAGNVTSWGTVTVETYNK